MTAVTPSPPALVPPSMRRSLAVVTAVAALVFVVLAVRYAGTSAAGRLDVRVDNVVDPLASTHHWFVGQIMRLGSPLFVVVLAIITAGLCLLLRRRWLAVLAIVGPGITGVATTLLKPALGRTLDAAFAFPSGHTAGATALGLVLAFLAVSLVQPRRAGGLAMLAAGALTAGGAVGTAMIADNAHYPTDTVAGFCVAVVIVLVSALVLDRIAARRGHDRSAGVTAPDPSN